MSIEQGEEERLGGEVEGLREDEEKVDEIGIGEERKRG